MSKNSDIMYDFHGNIPLSIPFTKIKPQDIDLYFEIDTNIGSKTCEQTCKHCWYTNCDQVAHKSFDHNEAMVIYQALLEKGYNVFPRYTDGFAYNGEYMQKYKMANTRTYYSGVNPIPAKTMQNGELWSSGTPLLKGNAENLLDIARETGFKTITMTFHGLIDENLSLMEQKYYPIQGVSNSANYEKVISIIKNYNAKYKDKFDFSGFHIGVGITIGKHNNFKEMLQRYLHYFNKFDISALRFNRFFNFGNSHPHLVISEEEVKQFYIDIKELHTNISLNYQLGISCDFGTSGIEAVDFPSHASWCRAGRQFFAIYPTANNIIFTENDFKYERIGDLVACVNIFSPISGALYRKTSISNKATITYELKFFVDVIDKLLNDRVNGIFKNGCYARDIMK